MKAIIDNTILVLIPENKEEEHQANWYLKYLYAISDPDEDLFLQIKRQEDADNKPINNFINEKN